VVGTTSPARVVEAHFPGLTALAERVTLWQTSIEIGGQRIYGPTVTREHAAAVAQILALLRQHGFVNEQDELVSGTQG
jgi:predicted deacylase